MQTWPAYEKAPTRTRLTAQSRYGVAVDDDAGVPAELEDDLLLPGAFLHPPPDRRAAGERQELEAIVGHHPVTELAGHRQDADRAGREADAVDDLRDRQHRQRVLRRGLEDDRAAGGDRRGELVGREVQREVERADRGHGSDREAAGDPDAALGARHEVERDELADHALRFLGAKAEGQRGAIHLDEGVANGLAGFEA